MGLLNGEGTHRIMSGEKRTQIRRAPRLSDIPLNPGLQSELTRLRQIKARIDRNVPLSEADREWFESQGRGSDIQ